MRVVNVNPFYLSTYATVTISKDSAVLFERPQSTFLEV